MNDRQRPDPLSDDLACIRCLQATPLRELDSQFWCGECLTRARRRSAVRGWAAGGAFALVLALYIALWIRPDYSLIPTGWVLVLAVAFYLSGRVVREFLFGWERMRNRRAVEASPPGDRPKDGRAEGTRPG